MAQAVSALGKTFDHMPVFGRTCIWSLVESGLDDDTMGSHLPFPRRENRRRAIPFFHCALSEMHCLSAAQAASLPATIGA
jgi:hypothetical protein